MSIKKEGENKNIKGTASATPDKSMQPGVGACMSAGVIDLVVFDLLSALLAASVVTHSATATTRRRISQKAMR